MDKRKAKIDLKTYNEGIYASKGTCAAATAAAATTKDIDMDDRQDSLFAAYYGRRYATLAAKFWRRIDGAFNILTLVFGSAAFISFVGLGADKTAATGAYLGLAVALVTTIQLIVKPAENARREDQLKRLFGDIIRDSKSLTDIELYRRVCDAQNEPVNEIEALRNPAWAQAAEEMNGTRPDLRLRFPERLALLVA